MLHDWRFHGTGVSYVYRGGPEPGVQFVANWTCGVCGTRAEVPVPERYVDFDSRGNFTSWEPEEDASADPPPPRHFSVPDPSGTLDPDRDDCDLMVARTLLAS